MQAPQPMPLPATLPGRAQAPSSSSVASFQSLTNTQVRVSLKGRQCCFPSASEVGSAAQLFSPESGESVYVRASPFIGQQDADEDGDKHRMCVCELTHVLSHSA